MSFAGGVGRGAELLDGRAMARQMLEETKREVADLTRSRGSIPELRVLLVGDDAASAVYARRILRSAESVGSAGRLLTMPGDVDSAAVRARLAELSLDAAVAGVILQLPLPAGLELARHHRCARSAEGPRRHPPRQRRAHLARFRRLRAFLRGGGHRDPQARGHPHGRSPRRRRGAQQRRGSSGPTAPHRRGCHGDGLPSQDQDLDAQVRQAEIVIVAAGAPGLIRGDAIQPGAAVIDCGINVLADGTIVGDVDRPSVLPVAGAITPVPGGVGPVTNAVLMRHLARAAHMQLAAD